MDPIIPRQDIPEEAFRGSLVGSFANVEEQATGPMTLSQIPLLLYFDDAPLPIQSELAIAIGRLEASHNPSSSDKAPPARLPLRRIKLLPEAFNARGTDLDEYALSHFERALAIAGDLQPLLVLPCRGKYVLVDGYHRHEAYRRVGRQEVPVMVFEGTVRDAVCEGTALNARTKVLMSNCQRQDRAWQMVNAGFTIRETAIASGVAQSQVSIMRKAKRALGGEAAGIKSWRKARRLSSGHLMEPLTDEETDAMIEAQAQDRAHRLHKTFGSKFRDNPTISAMGLRTYFGRRFPDLLLEMQNLLTADEEAWLEAERSPTD